MFILWFACGSLLPLLGLGFEQNLCNARESNKYVSPALDSLTCVNNYMDTIICSWEEGALTGSLYHLGLESKLRCCNRSVPETHSTAQEERLQHVPKYRPNSTAARSRSCPYGEPVSTGGKSRTVQCRYNTKEFFYNSCHVFSFKMTTPFATPRSIRLSQHVRVHPPANLSASAMEGGAQLLSWSSPYPASSPLTPNLTYQLSYKRKDRENWTTIYNVSDLQLTVKATEQLPGCRYEARVRARTKVAQWSEWSRLVEWQNEEAAGLECVLESESVVTCSWRMRRDLAEVLTYQLSCRHNQTAPAEQCCVNLTVCDEPGAPAYLRFSCSLAAPDLQQLHLELLPTPKTKAFCSRKNILINAPKLSVEIKEDKKAVLKWTRPMTPPSAKPSLAYEVRYWPADAQNDSEHVDLQDEFTYNLPATLLPSQLYQATVRVKVQDPYQGPPSEWSNPVNWTSHPRPVDDPSSTSGFPYLYAAIAVIVVFSALYLTIPACRRRVVLWEVSIPSPMKSRVLTEMMKSPDDWPLSHIERTFLHRVMSQTTESQKLSFCSTCSTEDMCSSPDVNPGFEHPAPQEEEDSPLFLSVEKNAFNASGQSFNGLYILCPKMLPEFSTYCSSEDPPRRHDHAGDRHGDRDDHAALPQPATTVAEIQPRPTSENLAPYSPVIATLPPDRPLLIPGYCVLPGQSEAGSGGGPSPWQPCSVEAVGLSEFSKDDPYVRLSHVDPLNQNPEF